MTPSERRREIIRYVSPTIMSQVSVFLFTIVDGIFVGRGVGGNALGAVNLVFPFVMLFTALTMLTTAGGLTIAAIRTGSGDLAGANRAFMHSFVMTAAVSLLMMLPGVFLTKQVAALCGAGESFSDMACEYLFWYAVFFVPCGLCGNLLGFCRVDGAPETVSVSVAISTGFNVLLDYILIFPLGMGLKGAAIATGAAQTLNMLIALVHYLRKKGFLRFRFEKPDPFLIRKIAFRGFPECISQFGPPISIALTNIVLASMLGDAAVNAYSVLGYAASFSVAVFAGTAEGLQPLFGRSYGARRKDDLTAFLRSGLLIVVIGSALISGLILVFGNGICTLYGVDPATRSTTLHAMPMYVLGFVIEAPSVILASYLYSTTRTGAALTINIFRSFVFNAAAILLIPLVFGAEAVWFAFAVHETLTLVLASVITRRADRRGIVFEDE